MVRGPVIVEANYKLSRGGEGRLTRFFCVSRLFWGCDEPLLPPTYIPRSKKVKDSIVRKVESNHWAATAGLDVNYEPTKN